MFKLYKTMNRDNFSERREATTGHDRFCNPKIQLPRYRRRRNCKKRTQEETELAFELTGYSGESTPTYASSFNICRSMTSSIEFSDEPQPLHNFTCPPEPDHTMFLQDNCADHIHQYPSKGYQHYPQEERPNSSWGSISKFLSSVATTLTCRNHRKGSTEFNNPHPRLDPNRPANYDYNRLGDESVASEMVELHSPRDDVKLKAFPPHCGLIIRSEKAAGHTACMTYLKSSNGRYVLLDQLPEIGWRTNRLWYVICDARVNAKRLLIATPCNARSPLVDSTTKNIMLQICRALQHPYVCPVLDLETLQVENFGPFTLVVTPVAVYGSLRDIFHKSQWSDHWPNKYSTRGRGSGLSESRALRFSCHILEAMMELRSRGLPVGGIGCHLHAGNVTIMQGTARFSGLDNVLMGHYPRDLPYISRYINTNLEAIDSIAFAYLLFSMCTGYEVVTAKLSAQNWNDVRDYTQALQILEYILKHPENRIPTLKEIANLDLYRTMDLRELRSLPLPRFLAGPPLPSVKVLLDHVRSKSIVFMRKKSRSTSAVWDAAKSNGPEQLHDSSKGLQPRSFSLSTPSISKAHIFSSDSLDLEKTNGHGSGGSSVYCTPPSSLSPQSKPSTSNTMEAVYA